MDEAQCASVGCRVEESRPGDVVWVVPGEKHWYGDHRKRGLHPCQLAHERIPRNVRA
jgi:hypothetical protein